MITKSAVKKNQYHDSVVLMNVSERIRKVEGVLEAAAIMATDNNKRILKSAGMLTEDVSKAGPNDLAITIRAVDGKSADEALAKTEALLTQREVEQEERPSKT